MSHLWRLPRVDWRLHFYCDVAPTVLRFDVRHGYYRDEKQLIKKDIIGPSRSCRSLNHYLINLLIRNRSCRSSKPSALLAFQNQNQANSASPSLKHKKPQPTQKPSALRAPYAQSVVKKDLNPNEVPRSSLCFLLLDSPKIEMPHLRCFGSHYYFDAIEMSPLMGLSIYSQRTQSVKNPSSLLNRNPALVSRLFVSRLFASRFFNRLFTSCLSNKS